MTQLDQEKKEPVVFLLALWGKAYIKNFFDFGLRTLLAPGNIPALAEEYPSTFLFLTKASDVEVFKAQPAYQKLASICQVEFIDISDLIFHGSYSATLTIGYERGMRSRGKEMCETYFFFLVSDYIMADGSLNNLKKYLRAGYRGITTGNFLVVEEYVSPLLQEKMAADPQGILSIKPREMVALGFNYLHPVSQAHTVNHGYTHATHANRLFWKVSDQVMVGRFYLRHMLCIKPESEDYQIGAACDYSFIAEMCPSGNVVHIQDSDDYFLIEMAPYDYEQKWVAHGSYEIPTLAEHLSKWTTAYHRANAHIPVIFHSGPLSEPPIEILKESEAYIQKVEAAMDPIPKSVRKHPYWKACVEDLIYDIFVSQNFARHYRNGMIAGVVGSPTFSHILGQFHDDRPLLQVSRRFDTPIWKRKNRGQHFKWLVGLSPQTTFWHLHWFDDYQIKRDVKKQMQQQKESLVIAFETIPEIIQWLEKDYPGRCSYYFSDFLMARDSAEIEKIFSNQKSILIWLSDGLFCQLAALLRRFGRYLPQGTTIKVYLKHHRAYAGEYIHQMSGICAADLRNTETHFKELKPYYSIPRRKLGPAYKIFCKNAFASRRKLFTRITGYAGLLGLAFLSAFWNLMSQLHLGAKKKATGGTIVFEVASEKN